MHQNIDFFFVAGLSYLSFVAGLGSMEKVEDIDLFSTYSNVDRMKVTATFSYFSFKCLLDIFEESFVPNYLIYKT